MFIASAPGQKFIKLKDYLYVNLHLMVDEFVEHKFLS